VSGGNLKISAAGGGGLYDNDYQWLECDNDASWYRLARTAKNNGIACYNGIAINDQGGLIVGSWDSPNALGVGDGQFTGFLKAGYNTNTTSYFGRLAIGYCGHNDYCAVSHIDRNSTSDYALLQSSGGFTN
jgi:hypothetical protein